MELVNVLSQIPLPVIAVALLILAIITIVLAYQYAKMQGLDGIRQDVYQLIAAGFVEIKVCCKSGKRIAT